VNDGTTTNENRLGAIGDIQFVIERLKVQGDLMIFAGDNLLDFEHTDFVKFSNQVGTDCIVAFTEENMDQLKRAGVVELDEKGKVLSFKEKPQEPESNYLVPAFYI
jgi:glucose-1-phosphate thymidylyltransferase